MAGLPVRRERNKSHKVSPPTTDKGFALLEPKGMAFSAAVQGGQAFRETPFTLHSCAAK